jgi:hypothetical protein
VVVHVVLFKPRADLASRDGADFLASLKRAFREIPSVRGLRVGRRVRSGAGYEDAAPDVADILTMIEFDDLAGLRAYLQHPAHEELGRRFNASIAGGVVYDFEWMPLDRLT